jgi:hypothetical protein
MIGKAGQRLGDRQRIDSPTGDHGRGSHSLPSLPAILFHSLESWQPFTHLLYYILRTAKFKAVIKGPNTFVVFQKRQRLCLGLTLATIRAHLVSCQIRVALLQPQTSSPVGRNCIACKYPSLGSRMSRTNNMDWRRGPFRIPCTVSGNCAIGDLFKRGEPGDAAYRTSSPGQLRSAEDCV